MTTWLRHWSWCLVTLLIVCWLWRWCWLWTFGGIFEGLQLFILPPTPIFVASSNVADAVLHDVPQATDLERYRLYPFQAIIKTGYFICNVSIDYINDIASICQVQQHVFCWFSRVCCEKCIMWVRKDHSA